MLRCQRLPAPNKWQAFKRTVRFSDAIFKMEKQRLAIEKCSVDRRRFIPLLQSGSTLNPGVDVAIVELLVEDQKELVFLHERSDLFRFRPR